MTIELAVLISVVSVAFGVYGTVSNVKRVYKKDTQADTSILTTIVVKLENLGNVMHKIESEMSSLKTDIKMDHDKLIRVDESVKQAHKRINRIEGISTTEE